MNMVDKIFIPGSEWVYFKLYTGTKTADAILQNELYRYIRELLNNGIIDKWFFIRYTDPDFHIRLRLHLKELKSLLTSLIHMTMNRWFRTKNRLHEMVIYEFLARYYASEIAKTLYSTSSSDS